jgi:hypothetical protein
MCLLLRFLRCNCRGGYNQSGEGECCLKPTREALPYTAGDASAYQGM